MNGKEICLHAGDIGVGTLREFMDDVSRLNDEEIALINTVFCGYYQYGFSLNSNNGNITIEDVLMLVKLAYITGREANNPEE